MVKRNITPLDHARLLATIAELDGRMKELQSTTAEVAETGGNQWHDNAGYDDVVIQTRALDKRIRDYRDVLNASSVVQLPRSCEKVVLGTDIVIDVDGGEQCWGVVGYDMGDPDKGLLAYNTPLARQLIGMKAGESKTVIVADKQVVVRVTKILISNSHEKPVCSG